MTGLSMGAAHAIADKFPWDRYHTVIDIGASEGGVPVQLALRHQHLAGGGFDLPAAGPIFTDYVTAHGLAGRLRFYPGDFFADPLPPAEPRASQSNWVTSTTRCRPGSQPRTS
jgi:hypothetical protein